MMKWIMIVVLGTTLTGCYVPHPANEVGVDTYRVRYVCKYNRQTNAYVCEQVLQRPR